MPRNDHHTVRASLEFQQNSPVTSIHLRPNVFKIGIHCSLFLIVFTHLGKLFIAFLKVNFHSIVALWTSYLLSWMDIYIGSAI